MEYYSAIKMNEIMPSAATGMDLEKLSYKSGVSQKKETQIWYRLYVKPEIWHKWTYLWNGIKLTDIENKLMVTKVGMG